jgi:hypothetical protein
MLISLVKMLISCARCRKKKANKYEVKSGKKNCLKRGWNFSTNKLKKLIIDYFFGPDCLVYYAKIEGSYKDAYLKTVKATRLELEEKIEKNKVMVNEFKSNQVFIYCHGMRVLGLNYTIYILIYMALFALVFYVNYGNESLNQIYNIIKLTCWALVLFVVILGKAVLSSFSDIVKWTYLNNYRLFIK